MNFKEFLTPIGISMIILAILVDVSEFLIELIPFVGQIVSVFIDIFAVLFIGGWMLIRSKSISLPKRTSAKISKATRSLRKFKWFKLANIIFELTPIVSSFAPCWVIAVITELLTTPEQELEKPSEELQESETF